MSLEADIARLAAAPLFGLMHRDALRLVVFAAERCSLVRGETLFRRGEPGDGGYVVLSGEVVVAARDGKGAPVVAGPGAVIARSALFGPFERASDVKARERSELLRVTPTLMRRILQEFPDTQRAMRAALADDLDDLGTGLETVRARLAAIGGPAA